MIHPFRSQLDFENVDGLCMYSVVCQVVPVTDDPGCKKGERLPVYITSNCGPECTGFETAWRILFFVSILERAHPGLIN